ncbi:MAG TPA: hypothetical protein VJS66_01990 [Burkholderiales bacterium]|nr:hypothetical protein [Burkholderiales bacterium]
MWNKNAICVACGAYKRTAWLRCKNCGREPGTDYELARALILSLNTGPQTTPVGRTEAELKRIGADIRSGRPYLFDPAEERKALATVQERQELERKKHRRNQLIRIGVVIVILLIAFILWRAGK